MEENLKDFTSNWIVTGLLITCLMTFTMFFMFNNNSSHGLGNDAENIFGDTNDGLSSNLLEVSNDADEVLNITANTNPEASQLGSRDSVASSYAAKKSALKYWEGTKTMLAWIFSGDTGQMLLAVFSGIIGFLAFYYIAKFIRNGI